MIITAEEISKIKDTLEKHEAELTRALRKNGDIAIEKSADEMDEIQRATERELAIRKLDRESDLLREVRTALARIQDGSFGTCIECDSPISAKRLSAVPWAPLCIRCREIEEENERERKSPSGPIEDAD